MSKVFAQIEEIVPTLNGWCSVEKATALAAAVFALRPRVCVEIGVLAGRSLIPVALALRELGCGCVIGIDPWDAHASIQGQTGKDLDFWKQQSIHDSTYVELQSRISNLGLGSVTRIVRLTSDGAQVPPTIDLLHLDGNHSDQAVKDVQRFGPAVRVGGLLFADDLNWTGGGVLRAVAKLKTMGFIELYRLDTGAMFQRVS
jgi:predicted O-methyltransferase YrrM